MKATLIAMAIIVSFGAGMLVTNLLSTESTGPVFDFRWRDRDDETGTFQYVTPEMFGYKDWQQYIGYDDKKGTKIYRDDLVVFDDDRGAVYKIVYRGTRFVAQRSDRIRELSPDVEVIGNVYP